MKKPFCIITCVRNESHFLPLWIKYYSQTFSHEDMFVIDNDSDDGSTEDISCNIIPFHSEYSLDYQVLVDKVNEVSKGLLEKYECIVYTDVDEFLVPKGGKNLKSYLEWFVNSGEEYITAYGYDIYHVFEDEGPINLDKPILQQRNSMLVGFDKTLITKKFLNWQIGFHVCNYDQNFGEIYIVHLHYFDFDLHNNRKMMYSRMTTNPDQDSFGWHNRIFNPEGLEDHFRSVRDRRFEWLSEKRSGLVEIPHDIKKAF